MFKPLLLTAICAMGIHAADPPVFQVTASQGDGSQCTATKFAGSSINMTLACVSPIRGLPSETHRIFNAGGLQPRQTGSQTVQFGDIVCLFAINPTASSAFFGSLGTVPATSVGYACSTNTRFQGVIIRGSAPAGPSGVISWP